MWRSNYRRDVVPVTASVEPSSLVEQHRFEGAFKQVPDDVNQFLKAGNDAFATELHSQPNTKLDTAMRVKTNLVD